jgi:hypothetical protein
MKLFGPQSPWNRQLPADAPVHPHSRRLVEANLLPYASMQINMHRWTAPVYFVTPDTPAVDVECIYAKAHGDRPSFTGRDGKEWIIHTDRGVILRDVPIPPGAMPDTSIALRPKVNADAHLCIVDPIRRLEWDFCWMAQRDGQWFAGQGVMFDLDGDGVLPNYVGGARASGFPLTAGLIFRDEIAAGRIEHPLVFAYNPAGAAHVHPPASASDGPRPVDQHDWGIPEGALLQLDPQLDVESLGLDAAGLAIARAMQQYGMYLGDGAGNLVVYAEGLPFVEPSPWDGLMHIDSTRGIPLERLRVIAWDNERLFEERPKPSNWDWFRDPMFFPPLS